MGWNLYIGDEGDRTRAIALDQHDDRARADDHDAFDRDIASFSREFSYALIRDGGVLRKLLTPAEADELEPEDLENPKRWTPREAESTASILRRVRDRLERAAGTGPVLHFLSAVEADGTRWGGHTEIMLPLGRGDLEASDPPRVKLDGGHRDPEHRSELRRYAVRVDPDRLARFQRELDELRSAHGLEEQDVVFYTPYAPRTNPFVEEPDGWVEAKPVLNLLGYRVEVKSIDLQASLQPELERAIACAEAIGDGSLYWLIH